eukprot:gene14735-14903_t
MAQRLAAAGLDVTLITEAQAGVFIEDADLVLLGADAVTPAGVVNKVGSKLLALAAKAAGVPVVAVTDSLKISPGPVSAVALPNTTLQQGEEEKEAEELLTAWGEGVAAEVPFCIVFTKCDARKKSGPTPGTNIKAFKTDLLKVYEELPACFETSAAVGQGRAEVLDYLARLRKLDTEQGGGLAGRGVVQ